MLLTLTAILTATMLSAQDGRTCSRAIPMEKNPDQEFAYTVTSASASSPKEVWFSAMTFDLPLSVYFAPDEATAPPAFAPPPEPMVRTSAEDVVYKPLPDTDPERAGIVACP